MKRICYTTVVLFLSLMIYSCSSSDKEYDGPLTMKEFITSAAFAVEGAKNVSVDNEKRIIHVEMPREADKTAVKINLSLAKGVAILHSESTEGVYNLEKKPYITLIAQNYEINFRVEVSYTITSVDPTTLGWTVFTDNGKLEDGIVAYKSPAKLQDKDAIAFIAIADTKKGRGFYPLGEATGYKTPTKFYETTDKKHSVIINGGFFYSNMSFSLIWRDTKFVAPNLREEHRPKKGVTFTFTRGYFAQTLDDAYEVGWSYTLADNSKTYSYPWPLQNDGVIALPKPSAAYPAGAKEFVVKQAIGGGPVLVQDGKYINTWQEEMFDADSGILPTGNHQRTAIGYTADGKIVFFVCEGRSTTPGVLGLNLKEVANVMMDLGCIQVMNLDGGGSTCMLINGKETIIPAQGAGQRPVASAVTFR